MPERNQPAPAPAGEPTPAERFLIKALRALPADQRAAVTTLVHALARGALCLAERDDHAPLAARAGAHSQPGHPGVVG